MAILEFAIVVGVQYLLNAAEGVAPDYHIGLVRFNHVEVGILFRLATSSVRVQSHFGFYKVTGNIPMNPVIGALGLHPVTKIDLSSRGGSYEFLF